MRLPERLLSNSLVNKTLSKEHIIELSSAEDHDTLHYKFGLKKLCIYI